MPGPLAAQLAIYLGYVHYRVLGATLVGFAFVIPSFLMVVALGWAYVRFGGLAVDAGGVLRRGRGRDRHHRDAAPTSSPEERRQGQASLGDLPRGRGRHRGHRDRKSSGCSSRAVCSYGWCKAPPRLAREHGGAAALPSRRSSRPVRGIAASLDWPLLAQLGVVLRRRRARSCSAAASRSCRFLRRRRARAPLADRAPVRRCRGRRDDHAGPGRDHGRFHRLPRGRRAGRGGRGPGAPSCRATSSRSFRRPISRSTARCRPSPRSSTA